MEKTHTKSALRKFVKAGSQSAVSWSSNARGMAKDHEVRDQNPKVNMVKPGSPKPPAKENTKPLDIRLHTQQRAVKRAMFNYSVATKLYVMEIQKKQVEKLQKMIEEEEIRMLRKEMVPKAQLMPFFDRPFFPQRSTQPLTIPREPGFRMLNGKCWSCVCGDHQLYGFCHAHE
ncbi:protein TPX2 [Carica papaya]|uniref:protein TPX2 n=1 Tax=Carica papaya TaxID=3649 RepID=UPI000B8CFF47|nr:protein TPX2 [Carica papaya]